MICFCLVDQSGAVSQVNTVPNRVAYDKYRYGLGLKKLEIPEALAREISDTLGGWWVDPETGKLYDPAGVERLL